MTPRTEPWAVVMVVILRQGCVPNKGHGASVSHAPSLAGSAGLPCRGQVCDVGDPGRLPPQAPLTLDTLASEGE